MQDRSICQFNLAQTVLGHHPAVFQQLTAVVSRGRGSGSCTSDLPIGGIGRCQVRMLVLVLVLVICSIVTSLLLFISRVGALQAALTRTWKCRSICVGYGAELNGVRSTTKLVVFHASDYYFVDFWEQESPSGELWWTWKLQSSWAAGQLDGWWPRFTGKRCNYGVLTSKGWA
jgi:hypothetical protein